MEFEPLSQPDFIGREAELKWLDERLFRRSYSFRPIVVSGQGGLGKTTLLKQRFATRRIQYRPLWVDLSERPDDSIIDEIILQLREPSERHLSQEWVNDAVRRIFNYKIVSAVVVKCLISGTRNIFRSVR